jgi:hypothetical protein
VCDAEILTAIPIRTEDTVVEEKGTGSRYVADPGVYLIVVPTADPDPDTVEGADGSGEHAIHAVLRRPKQKILNHSKCEIIITLAFTFRFSIYFLLSRILPDNLLLFVILKKILVPIPTARRQGYKV